MVFSENQVRHLYVMTTDVSAAQAASSAIANVNSEGKIAVVKDAKGENIFFSYYGADKMRSDIIPIKNIVSAKSTKYTDMLANIKTSTVTLNATPIVGQDYILKIAIRQAFGTSDQDIYFKYGMVHANSEMSNATKGKSIFYKKLAESLVKNFSRELTTWFDFKLVSEDSSLTSNAITEENLATELAKFTDAAAATRAGSLTITEHKQEWTLGVKPLVPVYFDVICDTILVSGDEEVWGSVVNSTAKASTNGEITADLEYFLMGERGDLYRNIGWPHVIKTKYLVDEKKSYDYVDITYFYAGPNEDVQKSQKTITIVCDDTSKAQLNTLIGKINTAAGTSIATIA